MSLTTPFPEPDSPELERFAVYSVPEIVRLLRQLRDRQVLVTLYYDQAAGFAVSNVLEVDGDPPRIVLDCASDAATQQALYASERIVLVGFLDNEKLQCSLAAATAWDFNGRAAFAVPLPSQMLRIQRRSHYRRQPQPERPATCLVPMPGGSGQYESLRVLDLSVGGIAVLAHPQQFDLPVNRDIEQCYLDLPEIGQITVTLRLRYADPVRLANSGDAARRCGCEFVNLSGPAARLLQRYMNRLDAAAQGGHAA